MSRDWLDLPLVAWPAPHTHRLAAREAASETFAVIVLPIAVLARGLDRCRGRGAGQVPGYSPYPPTYRLVSSDLGGKREQRIEHALKRVGVRMAWQQMVK